MVEQRERDVARWAKKGDDDDDDDDMVEQPHKVRYIDEGNKPILYAITQRHGESSSLAGGFRLPVCGDAATSPEVRKHPKHAPSTTELQQFKH